MPPPADDGAACDACACSSSQELADAYSTRSSANLPLSPGDVEEIGAVSKGGLSTKRPRSSESTTAAPVGKRTDYVSWDDYFMSVAYLSAMRSKDPSTQVGACIVNADKRIVGIGYNGFPMGCSDDALPWARTADNELDTKYPVNCKEQRFPKTIELYYLFPLLSLSCWPCLSLTSSSLFSWFFSSLSHIASLPFLQYVCHAEMNAILNKNSADVRGCAIYVALFPCNECAKLIIQSGIREVVFLSDKYHDSLSMTASRRLFGLAGVRCRQHRPARQTITIDFSKVGGR
ncbi:unnamed protein product [Phaeothamnion confervicola]